MRLRFDPAMRVTGLVAAASLIAGVAGVAADDAAQRRPTAVSIPTPLGTPASETEAPQATARRTSRGAVAQPRRATAPRRVAPSLSGPCTKAAENAMPDGKGHDHRNVRQHRLSCRMRQVFFDSLLDELKDEPGIVFGELDIERDLAAVAVAYPESGVVFFDLKNPAKPRFLSWYRGSTCEATTDVDCGAFVDLTSDAKVALLSVQSFVPIPRGPSDPGVRAASQPGVEVIDLRNPRRPALSQIFAVFSQGGVHTLRTHVIPPGNGRVPGEYAFMIANGFGVEIARLERTPSPQLTRITRIDSDGSHDTFIQNDPLANRTFLYIAGEFATGFYVYDVSNPAQPNVRGEWDPTPQCTRDWYGHTIDVAIRNGRRYVTIDAELFEGGDTSAEQRKAGCGRTVGSGDKVGPLWIVDATNLSKLGPAAAFDGTGPPALRTNSQKALVATWTNPAGRHGGDIEFSPHNQQIVGNRIYLSHYHGGVYVLDASAAFAGRRERPRELGFIVPHGEPTRPDPPEAMIPSRNPFFSRFPRGRPTIWDAVFHKGYVFAADMFGGVYSLRYEGDGP